MGSLGNLYIVFQVLTIVLSLLALFISLSAIIKISRNHNPPMRSPTEPPQGFKLPHVVTVPEGGSPSVCPSCNCALQVVVVKRPKTPPAPPPSLEPREVGIAGTIRNPAKKCPGSNMGCPRNCTAEECKEVNKVTDKDILRGYWGG